jgi:hypothetical protein
MTDRSGRAPDFFHLSLCHEKVLAALHDFPPLIDRRRSPVPAPRGIGRRVRQAPILASLQEFTFSFKNFLDIYAALYLCLNT